MNKNKNTNLNFHTLTNDVETSAVKKYRQIAVGDGSYGHLLLYEFLNLTLSWLPGALGIIARQKLYPLLFESMQCKVIIGRGVCIRQAKKISLQSGAVIEDYSRLTVIGSSEASIAIGSNVFIGPFSVFNCREAQIRLGDKTNIGSHCRIGAMKGKVTLGRYVMVGAYSYIGAGNHAFNDVENPMALQQFDSKGGVSIGDDVWLGSHVVVMDGVTIGKGAVIGAHSLVSKDIPPYAIAYGVPATVRGSRLNKKESVSE